ncbi:MAG: methyltransferase domain-containing protein [Thermoplasmata archaeon]
MSSPDEPPTFEPPDWASEARISNLRANADRLSASSRAETLVLVEMAGMEPGLDVLDLACGSGDPTLEVAARISPGGHVVGIDVSDGALGVARERASRARLTNVEFQCANAEDLPFPEGTFDRAVSRFGAMYFEDLPRALHEVRRVLRPKGRITLMVWGPVDQPYFRCTLGVLVRHLGWSDLPKNQSAPFRFAERGELESELANAGFTMVQDQHRFPDWVGKGTPEEVREEWTSGAFYNRPLIDALSAPARDRAWQEMAEGFRRFYDGESVRIPLNVRLITAVRGRYEAPRSDFSTVKRPARGTSSDLRNGVSFRRSSRDRHSGFDRGRVALTKRGSPRRPSVSTGIGRVTRPRSCPHSGT